MLRSLRHVDGNPAMRVRLMALLVLVGLVVSVAPLVVLPVGHWLAHL